MVSTHQHKGLPKGAGRVISGCAAPPCLRQFAEEKARSAATESDIVNVAAANADEHTKFQNLIKTEGGECHQARNPALR